MNFYISVAIINAIFSLIFGIFIFLKSRRKIANQTFFSLCMAVFFWSFFYVFWLTSKNSGEALFFSRALMVGAIFIPLTYLHFLFAITEKCKENKNLLRGGYLIFSLFALFSFSPWFVESVTPKLIFDYWPNPGILYHPFILIWLFYALYSIYFLLKEIKLSSSTKKTQLVYIFIGTIIGYLGGVTNYFLWYDIYILPFGGWAFSVYLGVIFYAIVKYRFLDIRVALSRGLVYIFSFFAVISIGIFSVFTIETIFVGVSQKVLISLSLVIGISLFKPIFEFFQNFASKYFNYTFYNYQRVLADLGKSLTRVLDIEKLSSLINDTLADTMKLNRAVILIRNEKEGRYVIQKNIGFKEENGISLVKDDFLTEYLEKKQKPLVYEELSLMLRDSQDEEEKTKIKELQENMHRIEAALCLPLLIEDKISGMIVLGNKISGDPYFEQDIDLLSGLSSQASIAFQNAKLYSEVQDLSQNLEKKVDEQVKELKQAYNKLQKLDKVKTEFMSIISHQLRTPLSIIKGHLSMINEGVYDDDGKRKSEILDNVYEANERLIALVNDVLNISRIQSGRVEINKEKVNLVELTRRTTERMMPSADERGIKLIFHKNEEDLPEIKIDVAKIENVIINLVDNAIKYTNEGEVVVFVKEEGKHLLIEIKDTGEGMMKGELEKLFDTFSRGDAGKKHWIQGAGLGLYIARQFVEMHDGKVWAESEGEGKGSQFYIKLPL